MRVDLPHPDGPMIETNSPSLTSRETSSRALTLWAPLSSVPNTLLTRLTVNMAERSCRPSLDPQPPMGFIAQTKKAHHGGMGKAKGRRFLLRPICPCMRQRARANRIFADFRREFFQRDRRGRPRGLSWWRRVGALWMDRCDHSPNL